MLGFFARSCSLNLFRCGSIVSSRVLICNDFLFRCKNCSIFIFVRSYYGTFNINSHNFTIHIRYCDSCFSNYFTVCVIRSFNQLVTSDCCFSQTVNCIILINWTNCLSFSLIVFTFVFISLDVHIICKLVTVFI